MEDKANHITDEIKKDTDTATALALDLTEKLAAMKTRMDKEVDTDKKELLDKVNQKAKELDTLTTTFDKQVADSKSQTPKLKVIQDKLCSSIKKNKFDIRKAYKTWQKIEYTKKT